MHEHAFYDTVATYDRGWVRELACTNLWPSGESCFARMFSVGQTGYSPCPWHGESLNYPCYSCNDLPWKRGMFWRDYGMDRLIPRCSNVGDNGFGDPLRCILIAGHCRDEHRTLCLDTPPPGTAGACFLPYCHPGDWHADRSGLEVWSKDWLGPTIRKSDEDWARRGAREAIGPVR